MAVKLQPVVSPVDGVVSRFVDHPTAGRGVVIVGADGYQYRLYHLNNDNPGTDDGRAGPAWTFGEGLTPGTPVAAGELIGFVGDSGNAEGYLPHVHMEIHRPDGMPINPYWSLLGARYDELHCAAEADIDDSWLRVVGVTVSPAGFRPADPSLCLPEPAELAVFAAAVVAEATAPVPLSGVSSTTPVSLDQFDPVDGPLEQVTITLSVDTNADVTVTNLTGAAKSTTVQLVATTSAAGPGVERLAASAGDAGTATIGAGGSSGFDLTGSGGGQQVITDPALLAGFVGTGTVTFEVTGEVGVEIQGPATWRGTGTLGGTATLSVDYNTDVPSPTTTAPPGPTTTTTAPNAPAVAENDDDAVDEDDPATVVDVLDNDSDPDDPLAIGSVTQPANGTVIVAPDGQSLTYQPEPDYCSTPPGTALDTFTYTLAGGGPTATGTVTMTVNCVPDDPTAVEDSADVLEDAADPATGNVLANDVEPDPGDVLTVASVNGVPGAGGTFTGTYGALVIAADGGFSYTVDNANPSVRALAGGEQLTDTFTYEATDGLAISNQASLTVTVTGVNDPPVADDDAAAVIEDDADPVTGNVLANDTDVDTTDVLTVASVDGDAAAVGATVTGTFGTLTIAADGTFSYTLDNGLAAVQGLAAGEEVVDTFTYEASDGTATDAATLTVTITGVNDPPLAEDDAAAVTEDDADPVTGNVLDNDSDVDTTDVLAVASVDGVAGNVGAAVSGTYGTVVIDADGTFSYTLDNTLPVVRALAAGQQVTDSFTYVASDGAATDGALLTITITGANDGVLAADDIAAIAEDDTDPVTGNVLTNDTDPDGGDVLSVATVAGDAGNVGAAVSGAYGSVVIDADGAFAYTLDNALAAVQALAAAQQVTDTFGYEASDGTVVAAASLTVTITGVDDLPAAVDDEDTVTEDDPATAIDVLANDTDVDGGPLTIATVTDPANGTTVITGGGSGLTYQPNPNYCNSQPGGTPDTFDYTLNGGSTATVDITVTCVPDPATVANSVGPLVYTENDAATVIDPAVAIDNPDDTTITAATVSITTNFQDGQDTLDWVDNDTGDGISEGTSTAQTVALTGDGTAAEYAAALAAVTYANSSDNPSTLSRTVTYTITAGTDSSDTIDITVITVDDPPLAVADTATVEEDSTVNPIDVRANDTDVDAGPLTISAATDPGNGSVLFDATTLSYTPDPNYCNTQPGGTPDTFDYTLNGGSTATVSVTVTCVNDPPVANGDSFTGANAALANTRLAVGTTTTGPHLTAAGSVLGNDTDVDTPTGLTAGPATISSANCAACNNVTMNADGSFAYDPPAGFTGTDTFTYTVNDNDPDEPPNQQSDPATVTVEVVGPLVWYVDIDATAPPTGQGGRSHTPFNSLAPLTTGTDPDGPGDIIFLGADTAPASGPYEGGIVLEANQKLWGEPFGLTVDPNGPRPSTTVVAASPATPATGNPTVRQIAFAGVGITLANGVDIQRVNAGTTSLSENTGIAGTAITTATIGPNALIQGNPTAFSVTGAAGGNITVAADITALNGSAVDVSNRSSGTVTFSGAVTASGTGGGVAVRNNTGAAIDFTGPITLAGNGTAGAGATFVANGGGTITASNTTSQITGFTSGGILLDGISIGAAGITFDNVTSGPGPAASGFRLFTVAGPGSFTVNRGAITATSRGLDVDGGAANITIGASLTTSGTSSTSVEVDNRGGGTIDINGLVTDTSVGIRLTNNGTGVIRFDGGINASTTTRPAFTATGGGTIAVTDANGTTAPNNTLTTTTGTALTVQNTTIHADDLAFLSISANGAADGIILNTTGTAGSLVVTGDGDGNPDGGGGTIQNTTSHGISLTSTLSPSLTDIAVTNAGNGDNEYGLFLSNVGGTVTLDDMAFNNAADNLVYLNSTTSSTVNVTGSAFSYPTAVSGTANSAILLEPSGSASLTASITGSTFTNIVSASAQIGANTLNANGTLSLTFSNNTISSATGLTPGRAGGVVVSGQELTTTNLAINSNTFTGAGGNGVISIDVNDASTVTGTISNNSITNAPGVGIFSAVDEDATSTLTFNANTITSSGGDGIQLVNFGSPTQPSLTSEMNATVTNNTVNGHSLNTAVTFVGGISVTSFEEVMDLQLTGNTVTGTPTGATQCGGAPCVDYYLEEVGGTFRLEEIPDTAATTANAAYVNSTNEAGPVTVFGIIDLSNGVEISSS
jgi:VCBS repeat-containing protein